MVSWLRSRRSAITFDFGATGIRAYQLAQRGGCPRLCDALQLERTPSAEADPPLAEPGAVKGPPALPTFDAAQLARMIGQGRFDGDEVALVVSPPEAQFFPVQLPEAVLAQPTARIIQALTWEVAQQSRRSADEVEVRYWRLPPGRGSQANVMAAVLPAKLALEWCDLLARHRLSLRRIEVAPCALVRLARYAWTPAENDLWGVLDLGLRHSTLTVVVGTVPTYIRSIAASTHQWTRLLAAAFEVTYPVAEQLKREHGVAPTSRGIRAEAAGHSLLRASDLPGAFSSVLLEPLRTLAHEVGRCFGYVMQSFPDQGVKRLFVSGGGGDLRGLPAILQAELEIPVSTLATSPEVPWEHPLADVRVVPRAAAALGAALLDLEAVPARRGCPGAPGVNLVPAARLHTRACARRRVAWMGSCMLLAALLALAWGTQRIAANAVVQLGNEVAALEAQRAELARRMAATNAERTQLLGRLQTIAAARCPQTWPRRLVTLAREAPEGVFLTGITIATPAYDPGTAQARNREARPAAGVRPPAQRVASDEMQSVRLLGYALDHGALLQFLNTLQRLPGWRQVELVRATQEPYRGALAVAFELEGRTQEERP